MQPLLAAPREDLTEAQVLAVLTANEVTYTPGLELLDDSNVFVEDISDDLAKGGSIEWDNRNPVHATCRINILRELAWGRQRVRPYMILSAYVDGVLISVRFNLGVYILTRPVEQRGEYADDGTPLLTYACSGSDLLSRLDNSGPAETYPVVADTVLTYFTACQAVITASGIGAQLLLDSAAQATVIPATRVWALLEPGVTWLTILTDLLREIGYVAPWPDPDGNIRSGPFVDVSVRSPEYVLDPSTADSIVHGDRTVTIETGEGYNAWRFISANADVTPTTGNGLVYEPAPNESEGPNSINALGLTKTRVKYLQVADAAELIAEGDKIVAADKAAVRMVSLLIDPLPLMWAFDVFTYTDLGSSEKIGASTWTLDLDGGPGRLQLGGAPAVPPSPVSVQGKATVTDDAPLSVVVDGALVDSFANAFTGDSYSIGQRVTITVRNPQPPLVQGEETP